jgi:hypothetical protein
MFVRQNCCVPLEDGDEDSVPAPESLGVSAPPTPAPSTPAPATPSESSDDKLKLKSR